MFRLFFLSIRLNSVENCKRKISLEYACIWQWKYSLTSGSRCLRVKSVNHMHLKAIFRMHITLKMCSLVVTGIVDNSKHIFLRACSHKCERWDEMSSRIRISGTQYFSLPHTNIIHNQTNSKQVHANMTTSFCYGVVTSPKNNALRATFWWRLYLFGVAVFLSVSYLFLF